MIAQIEGKLIHLDSDKAMVQVGQICYEVLVPGYLASLLGGKIGQPIVLSTMEYYEGTPGGGNLIPQMVGFISTGEKDFFKRYTSVKGIGIKKGLKSLALPIATVAAAVESGDEKLLTALPGIGKRLAQHIIAELKGKLVTFAADAEPAKAKDESTLEGFQIEALEILIAWGEKRNEAAELINLACKKHPQIKSAEELVPLVYRIKQGIEV
ncbi:MAG: Holliday junction ATP-dependent DNA helicase RuvA [Planctomycetes bacterium ADurb.Bin401]|nr:MAG: Holliday junction ATP-dependent DNA helicase RuvA [Planctomycetes bacterium ADurb.Bin401]